MNLFSSSNDLIKYVNTEEYFDLWLKQISKDFNESKFENELNKISNKNIELLIDFISRSIQFQFSQNQEEFFALIYRIDLPENIIKSLIFTNQINWQELALIIIKREFQKVVLKKQYSPIHKYGFNS